MVDKLIQEELIRANKIHPQFHSNHEGYAVILEEVEELKDALKVFDESLQDLWTHIKYNVPYLTNLESLESRATHIIVEAVQVAAMVRKYRGGWNFEKSEK